MHDEVRSTVIAEGSTDGLREIQRNLHRAGIVSEIVRPHGKDCSS
ncbi:MAG: hypothetical protein U1F29_03515 [Planctomycetota bacterium]